MERIAHSTIQSVALRLTILAACVLFGSACASTPTGPSAEKLREQSAARRNLGIDHMVNGRTAMAVRELQHAELLFPDDAVTQMWLGEALRQRGYPEEAQVAMERSLALDPTSHETRLNYSVLLVQGNFFREAIEQAEILINDPTFATPWRALTNRGWAQLKLGHNVPARASFQLALEFNYRYWPATLNLGILESIEGNPIKALQYLGEVLERTPRRGATAEANYRMASEYVSLGMRERALQHLDVAIETSPHSRWGRQSREYKKVLHGG
jgi:Tfp pilus assembly protein PilF